MVYKRPRASSRRRVPTKRRVRRRVKGRGAYRVGRIASKAVKRYGRFAKTGLGRAMLNPLRAAASEKAAGMIAKAALGATGPIGKALATSAQIGANSLLGGQGMYYGAGRRVRGRGRYGAPITNESTQLSAGHLFQPPKFSSSSDAKSDEGGLILTNQEFIMNLYANTEGETYRDMVLPINPGMHLTFPMLSQFAMNFEKYEMLQCCVHYESFLDPGTMQSETGQVGQIMMYSHTNVTEPTFGNAADFTVSGGSSAPVTKGLMIGVECSNQQLRGLQNQGLNYVRNGPIATGDIAEYDQANVQIAVYNTPDKMANIVMGRIHVSYKVRLLKPRLYTLYGRNLIHDEFFASSEVTSLDVTLRAPKKDIDVINFGPNSCSGLFQETDIENPSRNVFKKSSYSNMGSVLELQRPSIPTSVIEQFMTLAAYSPHTNATNAIKFHITSLLDTANVTKGGSTEVTDSSGTTTSVTHYSESQLKAAAFNYLVSKGIRAGPQEWRLTIPAHQQGLLKIEINFIADCDFTTGVTDHGTAPTYSNATRLYDYFKQTPQFLVDRVTKISDSQITQDFRGLNIDNIQTYEKKTVKAANELQLTNAGKNIPYFATDTATVNLDNYLNFQVDAPSYDGIADGANTDRATRRSFESRETKARLVGRYCQYFRVSTPERQADNVLIFTMPDILHHEADDWKTGYGQFNNWNKQVRFNVSVVNDNNLNANSKFSDEVAIENQTPDFDLITPGGTDKATPDVTTFIPSKVPTVDPTTNAELQYIPRNEYFTASADTSESSSWKYANNLSDFFQV